MKLHDLQQLVSQTVIARFGADLPAAGLSAAPDHVAADFSLSWPLSAAKLLKKSPLELAGALAPDIAKLPGVAGTDVVPPGFVNITLSAAGCAGAITEILKDHAACLKNPANAGTKVLLEFVSANPTGPLHVASGRGAALGDSLARILRALGYTVESEFYINDAGNQVRLLGESVLARRKGKTVAEEGYHGDYVKDLAAAVSDDSGWTADDYSRFAIDLLLKGQKEDMAAFRTHFDRWFHETELHRANEPEKLLALLRKNGMTHEADGAVWFGEPNESGREEDKARVLVRKDGSPTYFLNDIAYHKNKHDRGFDIIIDIWGADHHGYVPRMRHAMAAIGHDPEKFKVILHQLVHLNKNGEAVKMSKRAGEFITLRELTGEAGTDACRFFFASRTPNSHLNFDIELAKKRSQENPVFYVQYVHARISSILRSLEEKLPAGAPAGPVTIRNAASFAPGLDFTAAFDGYEFAPQERKLIKKMLLYPAVLKLCAADLTPHYVTTYLTELAGLFHPFYDACRVLDPDRPETTAARLCLCRAVAGVISSGLDVIGVCAPEAM
ncbi:MAG: arginine--tRNA ligase [Elusimicrobiaceae bacterium]|nr:arginine--tRNA ligase [Elusimicrobiaceae bacterium]